MCYVTDYAHLVGLRCIRTDKVNEDGDRQYVFYSKGERVGETWGRPASFSLISQWEQQHPEGDTP